MQLQDPFRFRTLGLSEKGSAGTLRKPLRPCRFYFNGLGLALLPLLISPILCAQDLSTLSLEDLMRIKVESVYSASMYLQKVTAAPASITIVTAEEIRQYGYRTLGAILQAVPGFYVTYDRNYTYTAVRGFGRTGDYNSRILLLVDGHRINDTIYNQAFLGAEFPVDLDLIERIEIIHGPSSSLYGSNAFSAVVSVITKKAVSSPGLEVALAGATLGAGSARITYAGQTRQGFQALVSGTVYRSHGPKTLFFPAFDSPETNNGIAQDADGDRSGHLFTNISYKDFRFQAAYGTREKRIPTASFGTVFNDSSARTTDNRGYGDLTYEHRFSKGMSLSGRVYFDSYIYDGDYPYNYDPEAGSEVTLNHDYSNGAWWGEEIKFSAPLFTRHRITAGSEYRDKFRVQQSNFDLDPFFVYLDDRRASTVSAFYVQDEYSISRQWLLNAGVRHDRDASFGGTTNPRLGLMYNPLEETTLKFLYGTAFRAPNAYELFYQSSALEVGNLKLQPETIRTAEVVVEQYAGNHYRMSGSFFQNRINRLIQQEEDVDGVLQFRNVGSVRTAGVQLVFESKWSSGLSTQVNYTYEHAADSQTGEHLGNVPAHLLNGNLLVPLVAKKLTAGLDLHYVSSRHTLAGGIAPGFVVTNLTLSSARLPGGLDLSGSIYNLFGTRYGYPGGDEHEDDILYQDGRTLRLKLSYTFGGAR